MYAIAKTDRADRSRTRDLLGHSLDVAHAFLSLVADSTLRHRLASACGHSLTQAQLFRLAILVGLHDAGKTLAQFQRFIREGFRPGPHSSHKSELLAALTTMPDLLCLIGWERLSAWFTDAEAALLCAIYHHGGPEEKSCIEAAQSYAKGNIGTHTRADLAELWAALIAAFPPGEAAPINCTPAFQHLFAGLVMKADWLGSSLPLEGPAHRPNAVAELIHSIQWSGWHSGAPFDAILEARAPLGAQAVIEDIPLQQRLVVIEAPTGTGKTEAAIMYGTRLAEAGRVDGMYFAVPLRSAAKELHARFAKLANYHPKLRGKIVRAIPGQLDSDPWQGEKTWAVGSTKKAMAAPIVVGTIDQALLACLRNKHAWMRHAALSRHLLVIDEAHASDAYMITILARLIRQHIALGGYVLCMSATLGEFARAQLEGRPPRDYADCVNDPYPVVRYKSAPTKIGAPDRRYRIRLVDSAKDIAEQKVRAGLCVLWIHATVAAATETYRWALERGLPVMLHHSRYADIDRQVLDARILETIGKEGSREPLLICATQTAEQSLDIDADVLITSACPGDVLLQRLGRLYRHRPGFEPTVYILRPANIECVLPQLLALANKGRAKLPAGFEWAYVYNAISVYETLRWLEQHDTLKVLDHSRELVERASHPEHLERVAQSLDDPMWLELWNRHYGKELSGSDCANSALIRWDKDYCESPVAGLSPVEFSRKQSRLGAMPVTVKLATSIESPFGAGAIEALTIPARWLYGLNVKEDDLIQVERADSSSHRLSLCGLALEYSTLGLTKA